MFGRFVQKIQSLQLTQLEEVDDFAQFLLARDEIGHFGVFLVIENVIFDLVINALDLNLSLVVNFLHYGCQKLLSVSFEEFPFMLIVLA